jgi:hypothetical protein
VHPHLQDVLTRLDASRALVAEAVARVPPAWWARTPAPGRWSVDQVLEHLALVDARFAETVGSAIAAARAAGLGPERAARVPLDDAVGHRLADRADRREAPELMVPSGTLHGEPALAAWQAAHDAFRGVLSASDGLALGAVTAVHRRWGPLTVYQWAEVMAGHESRHAAQIGEILTELRPMAAGGDART